MHPGDTDPPPVDLATVLERAPLGLGVIAPDGRYVLVNPALAAVLGRSRDEVVGAQALTFLHADDRDLARRGLQVLFDGWREAVSGEVRYVRSDGTEVWARITSVSIEDDAGRTTGVVLQAEDVTAERAVAEAGREMASLVAVLDEAVFTLDRTGRIRSWNSAAEHLLGWPAEDIVGQPLQRLAPPSRQEGQQTLLDELGRGSTVRAEASWVHRDGSVVDVALIATPVLDAEGALVSAIGVVHDIAEQKRAAQRLEHLARHDPLTGLPNRRELSERLELLLTQARRTGRLVGLLFVDLDDFKAVNDVHGHHIGDEFLRVIAARLHGAVRPADTLARWGGDEYVMVVDHAESVADLQAVGERLLETLARPIHIRGVDLQASASVGIATSEDAGTAEEMLRVADHAMYRAKNRGGSQVALPPARDG